MSDELILRQAIPEDAKELVDFYKKIQSYPYVETTSVSISVETMKKNLANIYHSAENNITVAINDGSIIGFCSVEEGELGIVVDRDFWHFGVGNELMLDTIDWFKNGSILDNLMLEVYKENKPAIGLYKKYEFEIFEETKRTIKMYKKR